jgi:hypothetical protein
MSAPQTRNGRVDLTRVQQKKCKIEEIEDRESTHGLVKPVQRNVYIHHHTYTDCI